MKRISCYIFLVGVIIGSWSCNSSTTTQTKTLTTPELSKTGNNLEDLKTKKSVSDSMTTALRFMRLPDMQLVELPLLQLGTPDEADLAYDVKKDENNQIVAISKIVPFRTHTASTETYYFNKAGKVYAKELFEVGYPGCVDGSDASGELTVREFYNEQNKLLLREIKLIDMDNKSMPYKADCTISSTTVHDLQAYLQSEQIDLSKINKKIKYQAKNFVIPSVMEEFQYSLGTTDVIKFISYSKYKEGFKITTKHTFNDEVILLKDDIINFNPNEVFIINTATKFSIEGSNERKYDPARTLLKMPKENGKSEWSFDEKNGQVSKYTSEWTTVMLPRSEMDIERKAIKVTVEAIVDGRPLDAKEVNYYVFGVGFYKSELISNGGVVTEQFNFDY